MDAIVQYLAIAGIEKADPIYAQQYNLCHASLSKFGIRNGLDARVKAVLIAQGLGGITHDGSQRIHTLLSNLKNGLKR